MSYKDRIRTLKYTAPSGAAFTLKFSDLSRTGGRKAPVTEFPGQNQGAVQDLGMTTPTFPITCYIDGENYDKESDSFWLALQETGPGVLSHPRWGELDVLPIPNSQSESFVDDLGRSNFDITFIKVDPAFFDYPGSEPDGKSLVSAAADLAVAQSIADQPETLNTADKEKTKLTIGAITGAVNDRFNAIADLTEDTRAAINDKISVITNTIDDLVAAPQDLQEKMADLYRSISEEESNIYAKIDAMEKLYEDVILGFEGNLTSFLGDLGLIATGNISGIITATAEATQYGTFRTRNEAADVIEYFFSFKNEANNGLQTLATAGAEISYSLRQSIDGVSADALNYLVSQSFNLALEKKYILTADLTTFETVYNLYGATDRLEEFIDYNNLLGDEIIVLPRGKEVRYYE